MPCLTWFWKPFWEAVLIGDKVLQNRDIFCLSIRPSIHSQGPRASQPGLCVSQPGLRVRQPGLQANQQGLQAYQQGLQANQQGLTASLSNLRASQPGISASHPGPRASQPGLRDQWLNFLFPLSLRPHFSLHPLFWAAARIGTNSCRMGKFSIHPSIRPSRASQPALRPAWLALRPDWLGLRPAWLALSPSRGERTDVWMDLRTYGRKISPIYRTSSSIGAAAPLHPNFNPKTV